MLDDSITKATLEVFESMIFMEVQPGKTTAEAYQGTDLQVSGTIGFVGDFNGVLSIHCPSLVAMDITGNMLMSPVETVNSDVTDAIGEIANMVAGGLKATLKAEGINVVLATPTIFTGISLQTNIQKGVEHFLIPFQVPSGMFGIELTYQ